ncbi:MAG: ParB N-terminal domain-containing protein [Candidatus Aminicenantes bacterium]|nr:ParB N-terminal domain-containing protein [Candidatus Aminicenantes bacterium]
MRYEEVSLRAIDFRDERYRISRGAGLEHLMRSIRQEGLVSPPVVCRSGRRYVLVTGWKRALACRALGFRKLPVLITEETNELHLLRLAFSENGATREFSLLEKADLLDKLNRLGMSVNRLVREYLPPLGLPATAVHLRMMLSLAGAHRSVRDFVSEKSPSPAVVKALLGFSAGDRRLLLPLLRPLGQNKQRQVLEDLRDVCRRDGIPVRRLFRRQGFQSIFRSSRLSMLQKAEAARQGLKRMRFPALNAREEEFRSALRQLKWPGGITAQPSPYFEEDHVTVSFRMGSREEFRAALDKLRDIAGRDELDALFRGKG